MRTCSNENCPSANPQPLTNFGKKKNGPDGYRSRCKVCHRKDVADYKAASETYRTKNAERASTWRKTHPERCRAYGAKRYAQKIQRTPLWLTETHLQQIQIFYDATTAFTKETGIEWEVDHIVPLQGENVSGLHVPWNLQVITRTENRTKSNKFCGTAA